MGKTKIEWATDSWNPLRARPAGMPDPEREPPRNGWYCEHVSPGCEHCYAETMNRRLGTGLPFKPGHRKDVEVFLDEKTLLAPLRWKRPRMIFACSMTDLFGEWVKDEWIERVFAVMSVAEKHTFQVLTKRSQRMRSFMTSRRRDTVYDHMAVIRTEEGGDISYRVPWPLPNVWLGTSAEDQQRADERIPLLLDTPAAVRFVSLEPLLSGIDLSAWPKRCWLRTVGQDSVATRAGLDWVIVGGESGHGARPMHPDWARSLRDQCAAAGVPFFMKQMAKKAPIPADLLTREHPR
jgi:protein gp37